MEQRPIDLYAFRRLNRITQGELAEFLGVTRGFISLIENGKANLPEDKLEMIKTRGVTEKGWDLSSLIPAATRLTALIQTLESEARSNGEDISDWPEILGIPEYAIKKVMDGQMPIVQSVADQIVKENPGVNKRWLMTGSGDMLIIPAEKLPDNAVLLREIRLLSEQIEDLNKKVDYFGVVLKEMGKMHKT